MDNPTSGSLKAAFEEADLPIFKEIESRPENFKRAGEIVDWARKAEAHIRRDVQANHAHYVNQEVERLRKKSGHPTPELTPPGMQKNLTAEARRNVQRATLARFQVVTEKRQQLLDDMRAQSEAPRRAPAHPLARETHRLTDRIKAINEKLIKHQRKLYATYLNSAVARGDQNPKRSVATKFKSQRDRFWRAVHREQSKVLKAHGIDRTPSQQRSVSQEFNEPMRQAE